MFFLSLDVLGSIAEVLPKYCRSIAVLPPFFFVISRSREIILVEIAEILVEVAANYYEF